MRRLSQLDTIINQVDTAIRTLIPPKTRLSQRAIPGANLADAALSKQEKSHIAGLMRVNHAGEVCAQALYQGQALTAKLPRVRVQMELAAAEEIDHLAWCEYRLRELNSRPSLLNPIWYGGSLMIGALAGLAGDQWSLGFVAETEHQVGAHLQRHLAHLPKCDLKSAAILNQMQEDEAHHADIAQEAGAARLPWFIQKTMAWTSKLMTHCSYYV